ncbi:MAG TPA: hypothetical protein VNH46_05535 [Gemmatimonadales bacterium]|nr:hypothetical protein [Gemmatimonadales bacterium]
MMKLRSSRLTVAVLAVAAVILVAGGIATASNMGFKLNKVIVKHTTGQIGNNWVALPYHSPYNTAQVLCDQTGLPSQRTLPPPPQAGTQVTSLDPVSGTFSTAVCGSSNINLTPGRGVQIAPPNIAATPASIILVGSHNPTLSLTIPKAGAGQIGNFWFSVPYHTTAVSTADLCTSIGLSLQKLFPPPPVAGATLTALNPTLGTFSTATCGASTFNLTLGDMIQIREPNKSVTFIPAHF